MMKKLTDEELSLVLSEHAAGRLKHHVWRWQDCGCVAGAVLDMEPNYPDAEAPPAARAISNSIRRARVGFDIDYQTGYPVDPEAMLDLLARAGL